MNIICKKSDKYWPHGQNSLQGKQFTVIIIYVDILPRFCYNEKDKYLSEKTQRQTCQKD